MDPVLVFLAITTVSSSLTVAAVMSMWNSRKPLLQQGLIAVSVFILVASLFWMRAASLTLH